MPQNHAQEELFSMSFYPDDIAKAIFKRYSKKERSMLNDQNALDKALKERYENNPVILKYSYLPKVFQPLFSKQSELGNPVKIGKEYKNLFFSDLATVNYFHTYISGKLTLGFVGGVGKQYTTQEKKCYKTYIDDNGLYQKERDEKNYIPDGMYRYIVSPKGGLYILTDYSQNTFHNSIRASQPVQCAGEVMIQDGEISLINNGSGHYRPTREQFLRTLGGMYAAGFITNIDATVKCLSSINAPHYLGTIADLIRKKEIKIPSYWKATQEVHNLMNRISPKV